jgi:hypothetical protein
VYIHGRSHCNIIQSFILIILVHVDILVYFQYWIRMERTSFVGVAAKTYGIGTSGHGSTGTIQSGF